MTSTRQSPTRQSRSLGVPITAPLHPYDPTPCDTQALPSAPPSVPFLGIPGTDFLFNVMNDPYAPIRMRVEAAARLLHFMPPDLFRERDPWPGEPRVIIHIGGLPEDHA